LENEKAMLEIIKSIEQGRIKRKEDLHREKIKIARKYKLGRIPSNSEIISFIGEEKVIKEEKYDVLVRKPVRTISGIAVIAVMTSPYPCPHGKCSYCPGGPERGVPQSYTGLEPATMRAIQNEYHPRKQVEHRINQLRKIGHPVEKAEVIIMGGTFTAMPYDYQKWFVKEILDGLTGKTTSSIEEAQKIAEKSEIRNTGLTVETRPDWAKEDQIDRILSLGATRIELGIQSIYEDVLERVNRGHTVEDIVEATRIARDSGFKICYHIMPGLPGSDLKRDYKMFERIFRDSEFKPDMIKIYPCLVIEGTKLYDEWKRGEYTPIRDKEAIELISKVKGELIPKWVRTMRIQRDIPVKAIVDGVKLSNLREVVLKELKKKGKKCNCIRCREVGHKYLKEGRRPKRVEYLIEEYKAGKGKEYFISAEDPEEEILIGYLRLRRVSRKAHREELSGTHVVRELHVYGKSIPIGERKRRWWQHRGVGRRLLEMAEEISMESGKISVLSGIGVREYYYRMGYFKEGPYVSKYLD